MEASLFKISLCQLLTLRPDSRGGGAVQATGDSAAEAASAAIFTLIQ